MKVRHVAIIGGGFAGLWVGAELLRRGVEVDIFERGTEPGGLLRSFTWEDLAIDIGPHIYFADHKHYYDKYLDTPLEAVEAYYAFAFRGRQIRSPITPKNLIRGLPLLDFILLTTSFLTSRLNSRLGPRGQTAEDWAVANYGPRAYRYFFRDYIPKVTGLDPTRVSLDWGVERERFYKQHNLFKKSFNLVTQLFHGGEGSGAPLRLYYSPGGSVQIAKALVRFIERNGGVIHLESPVERIQVDGTSRVASAVVTRDGKRETIKADCFISTLALTQLIRLSEPVSDSVRQAAAGLQYRHMRCIYFVIARPRLMDKMQIYFPEKKYWFKRIHETPPREGESRSHTAICAEVCYSRGDAVESMPDEELAQIVREQLMDYYGLNENEFLASFQLRVPNVYAIYAKDYRSHLDKVAAWLFEVEGLISFGRAGLFRYDALTDRLIDFSHSLLEFFESGVGKKKYLKQVQPKGHFL